MQFELYPAIDLKEGQAVRLLQGRMADATVYNPDPADAARRWVEQGARRLHVVDLDGAFAGASRNLDAVRAIVGAAAERETVGAAAERAIVGAAAERAIVDAAAERAIVGAAAERAIVGAAAERDIPVQLGGGLRSLEAIERALAAGVARVIIGTKALSGDLVAQAVARFGADRIIVGIDAKGGLVATDGWVNVSQIKAVDLARTVGEAGVNTIIYTDISKDGMMAGPNFAEMAVMGRTGLSIIASGGVSSLDDIRRLMKIDGVRGAILGKAIYTGAIDLKEALSLCR